MNTETKNSPYFHEFARVSRIFLQFRNFARSSRFCSNPEDSTGFQKKLKISNDLKTFQSIPSYYQRFHGISKEFLRFQGTTQNSRNFTELKKLHRFH